MLRISVRLEDDGCLAELRASGHASLTTSGVSLVCGAASFFLRTAGELILAEESVEAKVGLPSEGELVLTVGKVAASKKERMRSITDFLVYGLLRLSKDFPTEVSVTLQEN